MTTGPALDLRHAAARRLIGDCLDVIAERPAAVPPSWATRRGWAGWLAALDEASLQACEEDGLAAHAERLGAPASLSALAARCADVAALPRLVSGGDAPATPGVSARKRQQVAAFAALITTRLPQGARIVDCGAGHGHLTRHLAEALGVEGLGVEREQALVDTARALGGARFVAADLFEAPPALGPADLLVGLHACGALTDRLLDLAVAHGAAVAAVGCCAHKIPGDTRAPADATGITLDRAALGLANVHLGAQGVEAPLAVNLAARERRAALRCLLAARGTAVAEGDEMYGLNRRRAHGPLETLARKALLLRGLEPASEAELRAAERQGAIEHASIRRWTVARRMIARPLEIYLALDRGRRLAQAGYAVEIGTLWAPAISPRNIAIVGRPTGAGAG